MRHTLLAAHMGLFFVIVLFLTINLMILPVVHHGHDWKIAS